MCSQIWRQFNVISSSQHIFYFILIFVYMRVSLDRRLNHQITDMSWKKKSHKRRQTRVPLEKDRPLRREVGPANRWHAATLQLASGTCPRVPYSSARPELVRSRRRARTCVLVRSRDARLRTYSSDRATRACTRPITRRRVHVYSYACTRFLRHI
jgi:hypothetical protein